MDKGCMDVAGLIITSCCRLLLVGIVGPVHVPAIGLMGGEWFIMGCANGGNRVAELYPPVI